MTGTALGEEVRILCALLFAYVNLDVQVNVVFVIGITDGADQSEAS